MSSVISRAPTGLSAAVTTAIAVFSMVTGFLAGTAAFSARLATLEANGLMMQAELHDMRAELGRVAERVGANNVRAYGTPPATH